MNGTVISRKWTGCVAVATALMLCLGGTAEAGGKKKISYEKTARQTLSETKMAPPGMLERELVQGLYFDTHKSSDPDLDGSTARVINQDQNGPGGNGTHRGYEIDYLKNGDQIFQTYEGTQKVVVKDGGTWEANYQGRAEIVGGTGKYKNAKGYLIYKGRITPDSFSEQDSGEIEY